MNVGEQRKRNCLTDVEAERAISEHGENRLRASKSKSFGARFFENMKDPVIKILLVALAVNVVFMFKDADWVETAGIAVSVFLATFISTLSEHGSQAAFERLSRESAGDVCRVRRVDGKTGRECVKEIPVCRVTVGDAVLLSAGERIPADGVMVKGRLGVDQSGMTGESKEFKKYPSGAFNKDTSSTGSVFGGSTVLSGEGEMRVVRVGDKTFLGQISSEIQTETRESPLKIRLSRLARQISVFGYIAAVLCALAYLFNSLIIKNGFDGQLILSRMSDMGFFTGELLHAFTLGLTVVVMAVPEGLPMMIAVVLSSNIKRMVRDNVLVRKAVGIEAAGSMNILFTDKTGTLTEGKMTVGGILTGDGERITVSSLAKKGGDIWDTYRLSGFFGGAEISGDKVVGGNLTERAVAETLIGEKRPRGYSLDERVPFDSSKKYSAVRHLA